MSSTEGDHHDPCTPDISYDSVIRRKRRRRVNHVTKACDCCRTRKIRCDGVLPSCGPCIDKGLNCAHEKADGRKNRRDTGNTREQLFSLSSLVSLLKAGAQPTTNIPSVRTSFDFTTDIAMASPFPCPLPDPFEHGSEVLRLDHHEPSESLSSDSQEVANSILDLAGETPRVSLIEPVNSLSDLSPNGRLKRAFAGSFMQYGRTSFWSYAQDARQRSFSPQCETHDLRPGDWVDWARHLPSDLNITKRVHDAALSLFGAYYAPWCMAADMSAFLRDMDICNLVTKNPTTTPIAQRTSSYSPLLHNCALHLGLHFNRPEWPETAKEMDDLITKHCASMLIDETEDPNLSTPRALAMFAACMNVRKDDSAHKTGYIHFGMAFASVQALGVNLKCDHLVDTGQISAEDQALRSACYWTLFQQDLLRAICAGRPCMLNGNSDIPLPSIDLACDNERWMSLSPTNPANGLKSMRSTVFHWSAKLSCLLRQVVDIALSPDNDSVHRDSQVTDIIDKLDQWHCDQPFHQPQSYPVPHLLVMHMHCHLTIIYLLRPYFRATLNITPSAAQRCEQAADAIMNLLRVFERTHGLRNSVASIMIFATATIRLLVLASCSAWSGESTDHIKSLDECVQFMETIASTWIEARRALEVIKFLKSEWVPYTQPDGNESSTFQTTIGSGISADAGSADDFTTIMQEWFSSNGAYDFSTVPLTQSFDSRI